MTLQSALDAPSASPPAAPVAPPTGPPSGPPPVITANRRRLDNRFPVLAFSVRTQGRPWFEVLLTTDRSLFDPANAAKRTASTFYAGRQDGGLARASAEETAYVVPAVVLQRFAAAVPRPAEIFYTVAAYDRPDGPPQLAQPVAIVATTAPSVAVSRDFHARTMAMVLGVPAEKLRPAHVGAPALDAGAVAQEAGGDAALAYEQAASAWAEDVDALALDSDGSLEDSGALGYEEGLAWGAGDADVPVNGNGNGHVEAQSLDDAGYGYEEPPATAVEQAAADALDLSYDDGYDSAQADDDYAYAASSAWPAGAAEPEQLADEDDKRLDDELTMAQAADLDPYDDAQEQGYEAPAEAYADVEGDDDAQAASAYGDEYDDAQGYGALDVDDEPEAVASALETPLDIPAKIALVTKLGRLFESSAGYAGINADTEFSNPRLPQYQRWHVGLSYGFVQFTQDSGGLGQLLQMMRARDPAHFREIFGPDADALVEVTNRAGPSGRTVQPGGRSARVQPVAGTDLWQEPWLSRFRAAGAHPPFQAAQNELAVRRHLDPMLDFAAGFGLNTERALAMIVDRSIQMGAGGARRWLTEAIGPIRSDAQRQQALGALGFADVAAFQRSAGVRADGDFGPLTQAAMVGALRRLGAASPVPIPTREQLLDAIVARAEASNAFWRQRPRAIRTTPEFSDTVLTWPVATASR